MTQRTLHSCRWLGTGWRLHDPPVPVDKTKPELTKLLHSGYIQHLSIAQAASSAGLVNGLLKPRLWPAYALTCAKHSAWSPGSLYSTTWPHMPTSRAGLHARSCFELNHLGLWVAYHYVILSAGLRLASHQVSALRINIFVFTDWFNSIISLLWKLYTFG